MRKINVVFVLIIFWMTSCTGTYHSKIKREVLEIKNIPVPNVYCVSKGNWKNLSKGPGVYFSWWNGNRGGIFLKHGYCDKRRFAHEYGHHFSFYLSTEEEEKWLKIMCKETYLDNCKFLDTLDWLEREELFAQMFELMIIFDLF